MKRLLLIPLLVLLFFAPLPGSAAKSHYAERYDVDWQLGEGGVLSVTETVVFRFEGGPFTFVYRELPTEYADSFEGFQATLDGRPLPQGDNAGQFEIDRGNPIKITWHFAPTSDAGHTFGLSYQVQGIVRREAGADRFVWNALPTDYDYDIRQSTVRLAYPASLQPLAAARIQRGRAEIASRAGEITFTSANLGPDTPLTVAVDFPSGSLVTATPRWQQRDEAARRSLPGTGGAALALLALGGAGLASVWQRGRREDGYTRTKPVSSPVLPSGLTPAMAGALKAGGTPNATHALAALFGLAQRGVLTVEESGEKRWYKSRDFVVRLVDPGAALQPHEAGLLDLVFAEKHGRTDTVKFSDLGSRLTGRLKTFSQPLVEELEQAGLIDPARRAYAKRFLYLGLGLMVATVLAVVVAILLVPRLGPPPFLLPAALFLLSMAAFVLSGVYSPLSDRGVQAAERWQGFELFLQDVAKGRESAWDTSLFDRYFPYAAAFGLSEGWAKAYQKRGGRAAPDWFRALTPASDDGFIAFVAMTSAAHSSSAAGSGAGSGGAGGGGGSGAG